MQSRDSKKRVHLSQVYFIAYTVFEWGDTRSADLLLDGHSIGISSQMLVFPPLRDPWYNASTLVASRDDWQVTLWKHARDHALNAIVHSEMKSSRTISSSSHAITQSEMKSTHVIPSWTSLDHAPG